MKIRLLLLIFYFCVGAAAHILNIAPRLHPCGDAFGQEAYVFSTYVTVMLFGSTLWQQHPVFINTPIYAVFECGAK
jgi:hypothetical protein